MIGISFLGMISWSAALLSFSFLLTSLSSSFCFLILAFSSLILSFSSFSWSFPTVTGFFEAAFASLLPLTPWTTFFSSSYGEALQTLLNQRLVSFGFADFPLLSSLSFLSKSWSSSASLALMLILSPLWVSLTAPIAIFFKARSLSLMTNFSPFLMNTSALDFPSVLSN